MSAIGIASEKREEVIVLKVGVWVWEAKHQWRRRIYGAAGILEAPSLVDVDVPWD
jgi:hypothetical protein